MNFAKRQNLKLVKQLEELMSVGARCLVKDISDAGSDYPHTMRQLVEGDYMKWESSGGLRHKIYWPEGCQFKRSAAPVSPCDLKRVLPAVNYNDIDEEEDVTDFTGMYSLLSSFWMWLEEHEPDHKINIDHQLEGYGNVDFTSHAYYEWPLLKYFHKVLREKTGYVFSDVFPQDEWDWDCCDEPTIYDRAVMDVYTVGQGYNTEPLVIFLGELSGWKDWDNCYENVALPEAFHEAAKSKEEAQRCSVAFRNILFDKELELLDVEWCKALDVIGDYLGSHICCEDSFMEASIELHGVRSLELIFECGREVHDIRDGVDPLISEFENGAEKFWKKFIRKINAIIKENPSIGKPYDTPEKTLIEILT